MTITRLTSRYNPTVKQARLTAALSRRAPADLVLAEGIHAVVEAVRSPNAIEAVLASDAFESNELAPQLLNDWDSKNIRIHSVEQSVFRLISDPQVSQGVVALVRVRVLELTDLTPGAEPIILCACGIQDPGNLGTMIRSAWASGASFVCTTSGTVSARNPKTVRASAGAIFHIPLVEHVAPGGFFSYCETHGIRGYRAEACGKLDYAQQDLRPPVAFLMGNEGQGLTDPAWHAALPIHIPMAPGVESLNVAVAGSILLFESNRQRRQAKKLSW